MSIADEITRIQTAKANIKNAIIDKGGVIDDEKIDEYASKVSALPSPKEEQTKTVNSPNFASGNVVVTPDSGKVLTQVTVVKDNDLVPENIVKDVNIFGVVGTAETGGGSTGGYKVTITCYGNMDTGDILIQQANGSEFKSNYQYDSIIEDVTYIKHFQGYLGPFGYEGITEAEAIAGKTLTEDVEIKAYD